MRSARQLATPLLWLSVFWFGAFAAPADAGPPACAWEAGFGGQGADDEILAMVVWDDGTGDALYAAGEFTAFGSKTVNHIAKWDGSTWTALDGGTNQEVRAMVAWDDGNGEALYVGGGFTEAGGVAAGYIAKWDGTSWSAVGGGVSTSVYALAVWDDGGGEALYAAGRFTSAGGSPANRVAKWDGTSWTALGSGISQTVVTLAVYDDGTGSALYAGGFFTSAGGAPANRVAKWDGTNWSALGSGVGSGADEEVYSLRVWDDGGGDDLYVGGAFGSAGGDDAIDRIARWDGTSWSALGTGSGLNATVRGLAVYDDGNGSALYAVGSFTFADGVLSLRVARFDGVDWSPLSAEGPTNFSATVLVPYDDGNGTLLFLGGRFTAFSGLGIRYLATWDGSDWAPVLDADGGEGLNGTPLAFALFDDGTGPALHVGGEFTAAGSAPALYAAKWDGTAWSTLGSGRSRAITAMAVYDDGSGAALYATDADLVRWDGAAWTVVRDLIGPAYSLAVHDDGDGAALYVAGRLVDTSDDLVDLYVGRWDGTTWDFLYYSLEDGGSEPDDDIFDLASFDAGDGAALFAGGNMPNRGDVLEYDGTSWSESDSGLQTGDTQQVDALKVVPGSGTGSLYAGGSFTVAGGAAANYLAERVGTAWTALGSGVDGPVSALGVFDDGQGPALYAAGSFTEAGGSPAGGIARWDGATWSTLGAGLDDASTRLVAFDAGDGGGASLYAGGSFLTAGSEASARFARWSCSSAPGPDLAVSIVGSTDEPSPGSSATYVVTVTNVGAVDVPRSTLAVTIPDELDCSWTSRSTGGASGYSESQGALLDTLVVPTASTVTYDLDCQVAPDASGIFDLVATIAAPLDGETGNDQDTATAAIGVLFADGFESGDCSRWSSCS